MNSCPRGKFKRLIFYEEIKYALKYGYTIDIEYCYQFKRGKDLFNNYVNEHYEMKRSGINKKKELFHRQFILQQQLQATLEY